MPRLTIAVVLFATPMACFGQSAPLPPEFGGPAPHPLATPGDGYGSGEYGYGHSPAGGHPLLPPAPFRTTDLALDPHDGGYAPGRGFPHYDAPSEHYGLWYRPTSFGRKCPERCTEPVWKPRGYGNLFARSSACQRMEYRPFELEDYRTDEGPAYLALPPDYCCGSLRLPRYGSHCCNTDICACSEGASQKRSWLGRLFHLQCPWDCREGACD